MSSLKVSQQDKKWVNSGSVAILAYCASSILMTITNKVVMSDRTFNMNFLLLFIQSLVCVITLLVLKVLGSVNFRSFNKTDARNWFPISICLVLMIFTSSKSLQYLSVPVYTIFKNLTIIVIAYGEVLFFGSSVGNMELGSFALMIVSSLIAAHGDYLHSVERLKKMLGPNVSFSFIVNIGYFWIAANCFASALFVLLMRKRIQVTNFKDFDTMFYNNVLSLPLLLLGSYLFEDWSQENLLPHVDIDNLSTMIISGLASVAISYCSGWCVRVTSSTTYSMVGALNKLPIALTGFLFNDAARNLSSAASILLGFASGIIYAVAKQKKLQNSEKI
ncbi:hypothetical protein Kpol_1050p28 [Vanderwaltozyma polyspora DSM 70294]|uniref:GDP-mannose transporter 2 n=1 Tax=Vanderwaltozyma polyspora (strain ATCC 22028 / DSM 70294 / BCRC 21397 / CBS 2163 / NBRC 10782 / NRRL Y-8283 / UCD 57-17) TaxID=436907 RepID=GMT2_VANPO|nr:uncharacterized protein Kpol_1050p28 [Vanderwaltozyma polyspora DSM 70294]A7TES5.1 RecName: Full=GDP-mannose transporter 2; Short=GMT 2 [Vanderwaltozyma polyspora DSM 70294]EDO19171.1 hypothetical protein Kpol_1050p28 [Vanderwaltozyma polyspora DSM 70294]